MYTAQPNGGSGGGYTYNDPFTDQPSSGTQAFAPPTPFNPQDDMLAQLRSVTAWVNQYKATHGGQMPSDAELAQGTGPVGTAARQYITRLGGIPAGMTAETLYQQMAQDPAMQQVARGGPASAGNYNTPPSAPGPAPAAPGLGAGPTDYGFFGSAGSPYGDPNSALGSIDPSTAAAWGALTGKDIYGNATYGAQVATGTVGGKDTIAALQQKMLELKNQADIAKINGDLAREQQFQTLLQQTQDQKNALETQKQTADLTGYTDAGGGGKQFTAAQRQYYITAYGYDPGPTGAGIQSGGVGQANETIAGRAQTEIERQNARDWEFKQAQTAANPENAATFAALRGVAPWQQNQTQTRQPQTYQARTQAEAGALADAGGSFHDNRYTFGQQRQPQGQPNNWQESMAGGQAGTAEQNSPDWQRAGITNPNAMNLGAYDRMNQSQKAAFGSFAKAAGGSTGDYESQLSTYRPQKTQANQGEW